MTPDDFCRWLQGFAELRVAEHGDLPPTDKQWASICEHLQLVYKKETSPTITINPRPDPFPGRIC